MATTATYSSYVHPLQTQSSTLEKAKTASQATAQPKQLTMWEIFTDRVKTVSGAKEIGKIFNYSTAWLDIYNKSNGQTTSQAVLNTGNVGWTVKNALSFPELVVDKLPKLTNKTVEFVANARAEGVSAEKTQKVAKEVVLTTTDSINLAKDALDVFNTKISPVGAEIMQSASKISFAGLFIGAGWRAVDDVQAIRNLNEATPEKQAAMRNLKLMSLAKNVSYFVLSVMMLGVLLVGTTVAPWQTLACVTSGLSFGIANHFYERFHNLKKPEAKV